MLCNFNFTYKLRYGIINFLCVLCALCGVCAVYALYDHKYWKMISMLTFKATDESLYRKHVDGIVEKKRYNTQ